MAGNEDPRIKLLLDNIQPYPDFPKPGIVFQDIFGAMRKAPVLKCLMELTQEYAKKLEGKRASWFYKKSVREVESTKWVLENKTEVLDSLIHLPLTVNSYNAEFPHDFKDNRLVFSSLKADSLSNKEEVYSKSYRNKIYYSERDSLGKFKDYKVKMLIILI